jgi:hypothetical protein
MDSCAPSMPARDGFQTALDSRVIISLAGTELRPLPCTGSADGIPIPSAVRGIPSLSLMDLRVPPYSRSKFCLKGQVWPKGISASGAQIVLRFLHMQGLVVSHVCAGFDLKKQNTLLQSSSSTLDLSGAGSTNVGAPIVPGSATISPKL